MDGIAFVGKLSRWGNSEGVTIPYQIRELLEIGVGDKVKIIVEKR